MTVWSQDKVWLILKFEIINPIPSINNLKFLGNNIVNHTKTREVNHEMI